MWTLAHRGYSGNGRLDVGVYATQREALLEGARLALACGLEEDGQARRDFEAGHHQQVLDRYEETHPDTHLLRVQTAFLQFPDREDRAPSRSKATRWSRPSRAGPLSAFNVTAPG